jgi:hypothetical protein
MDSSILFKLLNGTRRPSGLGMLRPQAIEKVGEGLAGSKGKAIDFYRQVEGLIGPKQGQLYYGKARQLPGTVSQEQFLQAVQPRQLHWRQGLSSPEDGGDPGLIDDLVSQRGHDQQIWEDFLEHAKQSGLYDEVAEYLGHEPGGDDSGLLDTLNTSDDFREFYHDHHLFRQAERDAAGMAADMMGHETNMYRGYQRQFNPYRDGGDDGYFEAVVQDPGLARHRGRRSPLDEARHMYASDLWAGQHFDNPFQLGHVRGSIVPAGELHPLLRRHGNAMALEEIQSDPVETLGRYKKQGAQLGPDLEARYKDVHNTLAAAALHRFIDTPGLDFFALPTPLGIAAARGTEGPSKFHHQVYEKDLKSLYQLLQDPEVSSPTYNIWNRQQAEGAVRGRGIPYRQGGAVQAPSVQSPAGGLRRCSCQGK